MDAYFTGTHAFASFHSSGYICIYFRNIKNFMIQTGDPTGTGKGGQSIWGHQFADEIRSTIKVCLLTN